MKTDYTVTEQIVNIILQAVEDEVPVKDIKKAVAALTDWKETKVRETVNKVIKGEIKPETKKEQPEGNYFIDGSQPNYSDIHAEYDKKFIDACEKIIASEQKKNIHQETLREDGAQRKILPIVEVTEKEEKIWESSIEFKEAYIYNKESDQYVFPSKKVKSGNVVLSGATVRSLTKDYTSGNTLNELARRYTIPRVILSEVCSKLSLTHDSLPFTNEEIREKSPDELIASELEAKKFELYQKIEKEAWKQTQADALKWNEFKFQQFDPFAQFLSNWQPPKYQSVIDNSEGWNSTRNDVPKKTFVVGAFDWHIGAREEKRYMWKGEDWNLERATEAINKFTKKIREKMDNSLHGFDKCVFMMGGDLYNSITGFTTNGTPMNNEYSRDTQFEAVMNALTFFITRLIELFGNVECHFVRGNHGGTTDIPLAMALKAYFRTDPRLSFEYTSQRVKHIRVKDVLILLEHGASDQTKHLVPKGPAGVAYIQSLFLAKPELLPGVKQKLFIQGDLHHFEQKEYADFEFFMFGALPCGSQYADAKGFRNRPRQNCLIIGDDGVDEVVHIYVD